MTTLILRARLILVGSVLTAGSLLAACDSGTPATPVPPANTTNNPAPTPASPIQKKAVNEVGIIVNEWGITPKDLGLPPGNTKFNVTNSGKLPHNFAIMVDGKEQKTPNIAAGATGTLELVMAAGTYQTLCDIPGHKDKGMVGQISVK